MNYFNTPITNIDMAKKYFCLMGCSHFHMAREFEQRYNEYRNLYISKELEYQWRNERFMELFNEFLHTGKTKTIWSKHSSLTDLAIMINNENIYEKMLIASQHAFQAGRNGDHVIVAESINGRQDHQCRNGLIFHTYDIGRHDLASEFLKLSLKLAEKDKKANFSIIPFRSFERVANAINDCKEIQKELGI